MKSKEKQIKSKSKVPEGKFKDITSMFQQTTSSNNPITSITKPILKQKTPIHEADEDQVMKSTQKKKKTKADNSTKPIHNLTSKPQSKSKPTEEDKKQLKAETPAKKKKNVITDSSEEYDMPIDNPKDHPKDKDKSHKSNKSVSSNDLSIGIIDINAMDLDENTPRAKKQKSNAKRQKSSTGKKKRSNKDTETENDNEIKGPLSGKTIVVTGLFAMSRNDISNVLKGLGAKVTGSVSTRTSILLHGDKLEDGRDFYEGNKYKAAQSKGVTIYSIEEFEEYMKELLKDNQWSIESSSSNIQPLSLGKIEVKPKHPHKPSPNITNSNNSGTNDTNDLWTIKYKPQCLEDIVGNQKNLSNLIQWLDNWEDVVLHGNKKKTGKPTFRGSRPQFDNINAKACLISGDPGIGKTSSVRLIADLKGYRTFETNASEQRNKAAIKSKVGFLFDNTTLYTGDIQTKNVIVMDEIDGIGGNEDRGGIAALIEIIKKTKTPIICIANDRQSIKLRSLANHCYDLKFSKPDKRQVSHRLMKICSNEGINVELNALEFLCESVGNDIRQCINFLELWAKTHKTFCFNDIKGQYTSFNKDTVNMLSNFDAAQKLLNSSNQKMPFKQRVDLFFIDYDLIPLLIQENYLSCFKNAYGKKEEVALMVQAAEYISMGDTIEKRIRSRQDWTLLGEKGIMSSVAVNSVIKGVLPFPKFPELLGKMSSMKKVKRELKELKYCFPDVPSKAIKMEVAPLFLSMMTNELVGNNNVDKCLQMMAQYKMSMMFFKENILDLSDAKLKLNYDQIGSTVKAGFTREYNKNHKTIIGKSKKGLVSSIEEEMEFDPDGNPIESKIGTDSKDEDADDGNDEENGSEFKTKAKGKTKTKAKPKTKPRKSKVSDDKDNDEDEKEKTKPKRKGKSKPRTKVRMSEDNEDDDYNNDEEDDKAKPKRSGRTKKK